MTAAVQICGSGARSINGQGRIRTSVARMERQIYSLVRLTTPPPVLCPQATSLPATPAEMSWRRESNPRPADYKSAALPTELRQRRQTYKDITMGHFLFNILWLSGEFHTSDPRTPNFAEIIGRKSN